MLAIDFRQTDGQTELRTFAILESLSRLKTWKSRLRHGRYESKSNDEAEMDSATVLFAILLISYCYILHIRAVKFNRGIRKLMFVIQTQQRNYNGVYSLHFQALVKLYSNENDVETESRREDTWHQRHLAKLWMKWNKRN